MAQQKQPQKIIIRKNLVKDKLATALSPHLFAFGGTTKPLSEIIFKKYDIDKSGTISMDELQSLCYDSGCYLSDKDLQWAKIYLDRDGDGQITYNEFAQWWTASNNDRFKYLKLTDLQQKLVCKISELFRKYDKDNSGQLDNREKFEKLKQDLLKNQILKDIHELESRSFNEVDRSHDGKINFNELIAWFIDIGIIFGNDPTKTLEKIK